MPIVRFEREQLTSTAWKNGGGRTREIVRMPAGSSMDTFEWRASIADITGDGPFSAFAGFDRVIVLLSGDGVYLRSNDGTMDHRLDEPLAPFAFGGESAIEASLIGGASSDFNIMTRRATGLWWDGESLAWEVAPHTADDALIAVHVLPQPTSI